MKAVQCCSLLTIFFAGTHAFGSNGNRQPLGGTSVNQEYITDCRECMNLDSLHGALSIPEPDYLRRCCANMMDCFTTLMLHGINSHSLPHFMASQASRGKDDEGQDIDLWDIDEDAVSFRGKSDEEMDLPLTPSTPSSDNPPSLPTLMPKVSTPSSRDRPKFQPRPATPWSRRTVKPSPRPSTAKPRLHPRTMRPNRYTRRSLTIDTRPPTRSFTMMFKLWPVTEKPRLGPNVVVGPNTPVDTQSNESVEGKGKKSKRHESHGHRDSKKKGLESKKGKTGSKENKNGEIKDKKGKYSKKKLKPKQKGKRSLENKMLGVIPMPDEPVAMA